MNDRSGAAAPALGDPVLRREVRDAVALLTLNRPRQYNALSSMLLAELHGALDEIAADESIRVVMVTGAGNAFCAGHDLKEMRGLEPARVEELFTSCSAMMQKLVALPVPVIAVVNGLATAAGCQLVAQCDLAVAVVRGEVRGLGREPRPLLLHAGGGPVAQPRAQALRRDALHRRLHRRGEGARLGPREPGRAAGAGRRGDRTELAASLKAKPREALAIGKALFYRQLESGLAQAYDDATRTISCNMDTSFAREGVDAFLQKRPPNWES